MTKESLLSTFRHTLKCDIWRNINHLLLGGICRLCGGHAAGVELCQPCFDDLPWRRTPLRRSFPHIRRVQAVFRFDYPIREIIHAAKYHRDIAALRLLGDLLAIGIPAPDPDTVLVPVPTTYRRLLRRGYNPAHELALRIALTHQLSIESNVVAKVATGPSQTLLDRVQRKVNLRNAMTVRGRLQSSKVTVVDDVLTTGATISAMARELRKGGAQQVDAWVVAVRE